MWGPPKRILPDENDGCVVHISQRKVGSGAKLNGACFVVCTEKVDVSPSNVRKIRRWFGVREGDLAVALSWLNVKSRGFWILWKGQVGWKKATCNRFPFAFMPSLSLYFMFAFGANVTFSCENMREYLLFFVQVWVTYDCTIWKNFYWDGFGWWF